MSQYTITRSDILSLSQARALQVQQARQNYRASESEELPADHPANSPDWARVQFVNGSTTDTALPIGRLAKWAKTLPEGACLTAEITGETIAFRYIWPDARTYTSEIRLRLHAEQAPVATRHHKRLGTTTGTPRDFFGAPLAATAPMGGGNFTFDFDTTQAESLKSATQANRAAAKDQKWLKQIATAKQAERDALKALQAAAASHVANLTTIAAMPRAAAIAKAKAIRAARHELRASLAAFDTMPAWLPEYRDAGLDPAFFDESARDFYNRPQAGYAENQKRWIQAKAAKAAYNPPMRWDKSVIRNAKWCNLTPDAYAAQECARYNNPQYYTKKPVLGPKWIALDEAVTKAEKNLRDFIGQQFRKEIEARGLPTQAGWEGYFYPGEVCQWSRARLAVRRWPDVKASLAARYLAARMNTAHVQTLNPQAA